MAWVEQRGTRYRVRMRMPDGSVGTDSSHPTRGAAELRCKQVEVDQALDTYLDPALGRITLGEWVAIWEPATKLVRRSGPPTVATYATTSSPGSATCP